MTRSELIDRITSRFPQLSHADVKTCVDSVLAAMTETMAKGERIEVRGFGSFDVKERKPRIGRNPKTGVRVQVPAKRMPHFKPGKEFREGVDYQAEEARLSETKAWLATINKNMDRMSADEAYRLVIAKNLS